VHPRLASEDGEPRARDGWQATGKWLSALCQSSRASEVV